MQRLLLLALALACGPAFAGLIEGRVIEVPEGNSLTILAKEGASRHRIRLAGIAVPAKQQPYADRSRENLRRMAVGKTVRVESSTLDGRGRLVGIVWVVLNPKECRVKPCPDLLDAGLAQVLSGFAWVDQNQSSLSSEDNKTRYGIAQTQAKANRLGFWRESRLPMRAELRDGDSTGVFPARSDAPASRSR